MEIIIVDTSVWINFFKGIGTKASLFLKNNTELPLATCPTILQEVLQGVRLEHEVLTVESTFDEMVQLIEEPYEIAVEAAQLYRKLRKAGVTVRKPNDCLIAMYAIKNKIKLLHDDVDFDHIARHSDLQLVDLN